MLEQILAALGLITAFGAAVGYLVKLWRWAKTPNATQDKRLNEVEKRLDNHDKMLDNDKRAIDQLKEGTRINMRLLMAMSSHMLDGNHTQQLKDATQQMNDFLLNS